MRYRALNLWHRELKAGVRTEKVHDTLWRAACWEYAAKIAPSKERRQHCLWRARQIIEKAAARKREAA